MYFFHYEGLIIGIHHQYRRIISIFTQNQLTLSLSFSLSHPEVKERTSKALRVERALLKIGRTENGLTSFQHLREIKMRLKMEKIF
ncbi:hypothetical protein HOLleu_02466 [Holothuria leucospilota]|uniref:Uncharacterized protein n=1 Tax=Holothuria leucospilota TaxID=206669 RepID=A0A9Q1HLF5_HOLLE|nr:hypothetical protein HOLleu_02466 [Holothuria leucospilota]